MKPEYIAKLAKAGFSDVSIENSRIYSPADALDVLTQAGISQEAAAVAEGKFASAFVRATKPQTAKTCCGPECCA